MVYYHWAMLQGTGQISVHVWFPFLLDCMRVIAWHMLYIGFAVWEWAASAVSMPAEELILCLKSSWTSDWRPIKWENGERIDHGQLGWKAAACYA